MKSTYGELNAFFIFSDTSSIEKKTNPVPVEEKNPEQNLTSNITFVLGVISEREKLLMNIMNKMK